MLVDKDDEFRKAVIGLGNGRIDALHHPPFRLQGRSLRSVYHKDGSHGLHTQLTILAHAVQGPLPQKYSMVGREWVGFIECIINAFQHFLLLFSPNSPGYVQIRYWHKASCVFLKILVAVALFVIIFLFYFDLIDALSRLVSALQCAS